jgi:hypothetical protein
VECEACMKCEVRGVYEVCETWVMREMCVRDVKCERV